MTRPLSRPARPAARRATAVSPREAPVVPLQRQTVTSMTLAMLRERILRGGHADGAPLRQDAIAAELGVSRIPVREALRQLEAEGLVTFNPHRGAIVSSLSLAEIDEVFSLRASVESDLVRRATPRLTEAELRRAAEILDEYEEALRTGEVAAYGQFNWQFHSALYGAAERPVTLGVVQRLHQLSDRYARMQLALTHGESRANQEHRAILAAVRKRDARRAVTLMRQHILNAGRALVDFIEAERADPPRRPARARA